MDNNSQFVEDSSYVDVNGREVKVYVSEKSGQIVIPIQEARKTGFNIYHKTQYNKLHISADQFLKEFHLYMLDAAKTYMLQRQTAFKEDDIFESINRCRKALAEEDVNNSTNQQFFSNRIVSDSPQGFTITRPTQFNDTLKLLTTDSVNKSQHHRTSSFANSNHVQSPTGSERSSSINKFKRENGQNQPNNHGIALNTNANKSWKQNGFANEQKKNEDRKEILPRLPTVRLERGFHNVMVIHLELPEIIFVQVVSNAETLLFIDKTIKEQVDTMPVVTNLVFNQIYISEYDGEWARCKVIKFKPLKIFFIDYGNTSSGGEIRESPSTLANIPCQAVKVSLNNPTETIELLHNYRIKVVNVEMGVPIVDIVHDDDKNKEEVSPSLRTATNELSPPPAAPVVKKVVTNPVQKINTPTYFTLPKEMDPIERGTVVCLANRSEDRLMVRTKESVARLRKMEKLIDESVLSSIDNPRLGQVVLCTIEDNTTHRGFVETILKDAIEVKLLDYLEKKIVEKGCVKHISKELSEETITFRLTPPIKNYSDVKAINDYLNEITEKRLKGTVQSDGDLFDVKLPIGLLSDKLSELVPATSSSTLDKAPTRSFPVFTPTLGLGHYYIYFYDTSKNFSITPVEDLEQNLSVVMKQDLEEDASYIPKIEDVCYANYDGAWSRALILKEKDKQFEIKFIDFGNVLTVDASDLRKLTDDAKTVPMLSVSCQLVGSLGATEFEEKLKNTIQEGDSYSIDVKQSKGKFYEVEIPALLQTIS